MLLKGDMDVGGGLGGVMGGGSGSHTNSVVASLHWRGGGGSPLKSWDLVHSRPLFCQDRSS